MYHVPMCRWCGEYEIGAFGGGSEDFCSETCTAEFNEDAYGDGEPEGSYDLSDDAEALASAGFGTDEDYGYYGDE